MPAESARRFRTELRVVMTSRELPLSKLVLAVVTLTRSPVVKTPISSDSRLVPTTVMSSKPELAEVAAVDVVDVMTEDLANPAKVVNAEDVVENLISLTMMISPLSE